MFQELQSPSEVSRKIFARVRVVIVMVSSYVLTMLRYMVVSIVYMKKSCPARKVGHTRSRVNFKELL